ncbi:MAG: ABC transporter ATP-binding protein [SAR324 cluster bacterium]|nr:ABC transporter ATP-binding protein [SAR324 cluster bacterium]
MIEIKNVSKTFPNGFQVLKNVSLRIEKGEFFALLGPSGCGKTSLLRMIAGFIYPDEGQVLIDGKDVSEVAPYQRAVNMVFQSYAVFPHMSVYDNIAYGLVVDKISKKEIANRVTEVVQLVQLEGLEKSMPSQLSGGQKQRVAVARALAKKPKALLLDEPLSALDAKLREGMRNELVKIQKKSAVTFVFVTHDQSEALSISDRLAVMRDGDILQVGRPYGVYEKPETSFVADFIGSTNLLPARLDDNNLVQIDGVKGMAWKLDHKWPRDMYITLRPEKVRLMVDAVPDKSHIMAQGVISVLVYLGEKTMVEVKLASGKIMKCSLSEYERKTISSLKMGKRVWCFWDEKDMMPLAK